jgi:hypothetical protein
MKLCPDVLMGMMIGSVVTLIATKRKKQKKGPYKGKEGGKNQKLNEASYFLVGMMNNQGACGSFQFNYSAFLSAARSVLQYAHEEVDQDRKDNKRRNAINWYQKAVEKNKAIKWGQDERDENIHHSPATPNASVKVFPKEIVANIENVFAYLNRTLVSDGSQKPKSESAEPTTYARPEYKYTSSRWEGPEDLLEVCAKYLRELDALVKDGVSKGYITR